MFYIYAISFDKSVQIPYITVMANNVNILKASFRGKVGSVYGDDSRGVAKVKAIPFSHAPTKESVKQQCRAFECLNRVSSGIAKYGWAYLNLSDKKMLRHNAVASWLKAGVGNASFDFSKLAETIGTNGTTEIETVSVNRLSGSFSINFSLTGVPVPDNKNNAVVVLLCDDTGKVILGDNPKSNDYSFSGVARLFTERRYFVVVFQSFKNNGKWKTTGYAYKECSYLE